MLNQYQRRADLIPNIVNTVKGEANFEQETLTKVIEARAKATSIQVTPETLNNPEAFNRFQQAQGELSSALSRLMVVSENYPNLKANQGFQDLRVQLEGTENRITVARNRYIKSVAEYNVLARSFPTNLTAMVFGYDVKPNFTVQNEAQISTPPTVDFDKPAPPQRPPRADARAECAAHWPWRWRCCWPRRRCSRRTCCRCRRSRARVIDQTGTLTEPQRAALEPKLAAFEGKAGHADRRADGADHAPEDIAAYAQRVADQWKIGRRDVGDGVLIVVAKNDRRVRIEVAKALEGAMPDLAARQIIDRAITPAFRAGDFAGGLNAGGRPADRAHQAARTCRRRRSAHRAAAMARRPAVGRAGDVLLHRRADPRRRAHRHARPQARLARHRRRRRRLGWWFSASLLLAASPACWRWCWSA